MLEILARGLTNKFLHAPTQALNQAGDAERAELVALFQRIYQIPDGVSMPESVARFAGGQASRGHERHGWRDSRRARFAGTTVAQDLGASRDPRSTMKSSLRTKLEALALRLEELDATLSSAGRDARHRSLSRADQGARGHRAGRRDASANTGRPRPTSPRRRR